MKYEKDFIYYYVEKRDILWTFRISLKKYDACKPAKFLSETLHLQYQSYNINRATIQIFNETLYCLVFNLTHETHAL